MSASNVRGSCLCGKTSYQISGNLGVFQYCHCSRCRKFTGSAHAANILVSPDQFEWLDGEQNITRFEPAGTKHFATSFCKHCGSSMPWLGKSKRAVVVPAGSLDSDPEIRPFQNIFWDSKADWYQDASALPKHKELPIKS